MISVDVTNRAMQKEEVHYDLAAAMAESQRESGDS